MSNRPHRRQMQESSRRRAVLAIMTASFLTSGSTASAQRGLVPGPGEVAAPVIRSADEGLLHAAVRREGARLAQNSASDPQTARAQDPGWIVRHPVLVGTLIGTAGGAALSRVDTIGGANHDPRVALTGAGAGAWAGLVASAVRKARSKEKVGVGANIGIAAPGDAGKKPD